MYLHVTVTIKRGIDHWRFLDDRRTLMAVTTTTMILTYRYPECY